MKRTIFILPVFLFTAITLSFAHDGDVTQEHLDQHHDELNGVQEWINQHENQHVKEAEEHKEEHRETAWENVIFADEDPPVACSSCGDSEIDHSFSCPVHGKSYTCDGSSHSECYSSQSGEQEGNYWYYN